MSALTINLLFSTLIFGIIARIYLWPRLDALSPRTILLPILLLHSFRHLGLMFVTPGATHAGMPAAFAYPAAYGDLLAALLALAGIATIAGGSRRALSTVWAFNIVGALDLLVAIVLATAFDASPYMGPSYWIPAFWVPALLVTHYITFVVLRRQGARFVVPRAGARAPLAAVVLLGLLALPGCASASRGEYTSSWSPRQATDTVSLDNGFTLRYLRTGQGRPLVLLHTIRTQLDYFERLVPLLSEHHEVIALDLPGHGQSSILRVDYTEPLFRESVIDFIDRLELRDATLVGESIGGVLALTVAAERPDLVGRVIALNPYDYGEKFGGGIRRSRNGAVIGLFRVFRGRTVESRGVLSAVLAGGFEDAGRLPAPLLREFHRTGRRPGHRRAGYSVFRNWRSWIDARELYGAVDAPVTLVYGEHDWSYRHEREQNQLAISGAELVTIEGSGHFTSLENPLAVADIILSRTLGIAARPLPGPAVAEVRLYVLECGTIDVRDLGYFAGETGERRELANACYLVVHPHGALLWDTGLPDELVHSADGHDVLDFITFHVTRTLASQLEQIGVDPGVVRYLGISHMHVDHLGNAALFPRATLLIQRAEFDAAFSPDPARYGFDPATFATLASNPVWKLDGDTDVFGDGTVVITSAPGHTPGHQALLVRLRRTGTVLLAGDAAHLMENWLDRRVPAFNYDTAQSALTMERLAELIEAEGADIWIQHDAAQNARLRKAPAYYD